MDFSGWPSGLGGAWSDLRAFLEAIRFVRPGLLWFTFVPLLLLLLDWWASARNRVVAERLGRVNAIRNLATATPRRISLKRFCFGLAWTSLMIGVAGPRWGQADDGGVAVGRDVIVVIDLSRSMEATDLRTPEPRWKRACEEARDLIEAAARRGGGHRVGIIIFAARPKVLVPLTTDYDHLILMLDELDGHVQPVDIRPADEFAKSGTRIGAALTLAVQTHDDRFPGKQDIILLSDGDDPATDREWADGITPARSAGIPIHVVGIGDVAESPVMLKRRGGEGELISTRLVELPLKTIALESRGQYMTGSVGDFFEKQLAPLPSRELTDDPTTALRNRSTVFWLIGMIFLMLAWFWRA